jgi:signal transduction histidine kinase
VLRADIVWGRESRSSGKLELDARSSWSFDDEDRDLLEWVARHSASDCELVEKKLALDDWAAELHRLDDPFSIADKILVRIKQEFQFEGGLVYRAFPRAQRLLGFAGLPHGNRDFHASPYIYSLTEDSAATYAFKHEAFSTWDGQDSRVNQEGRKYFEFEGSLFAVPLGEANNRFGAVVVWKKHDKLTDAERAPIESRLKELTRQAASALRLALFSQNTESRRKFQERVAQLLQQMMQESELDKNLRAIMPAIAESGFTRIRLYRVRFGDRLVGEMAQGMGELQDLFEGSSRYEIQIVDNYYTKLMFDGVCAARKGDPLPENLLARLYPRKDEQTGQLAQDGSAERLNKPGRMPWAEVPVLSGGKLYGLIAADKLFDPAPSSDTNQAWGEITDVDLDALDVFAQLAGRAFEMDEKRGMLVQRHLRVLDDFVGPTEPVDLVRRRLLCFLTHGEEGLGYPRAALFLPAGEARHGVYRFCQAVGAANKKEFEHVAPAVCLLSLSEVLRNASLEHDVALNASLRDFEIDLGEDVALGGPTVVAHSADAHGAEWVARLKALGWDQFFVARLIASNQDVGLLVADKTWDHFGLNKSDEAVLDSAARHAAQILVRHGAVAQRLEDVHYVAKGVMHEFRTPLIHIRSAAEAIEHPADIHALPGHVDALKTAIEIMNARLGTMESAFFNTMPTANTEAGELLRLDDELKNWMDRDHVKLTVTDNAPGVRVQVRADAIRLAVNNLVRNSLESFKIALKPAPTIELRADVDGGRLRLSVADNGRGVSKQVLEQLMDLIPRFSTKNTKKEGGFGLFLASWIVRKHGGALKLHSSENVGFSATILLPID